MIYEATKGLPRDAIKVCNSALTHAYANQLERTTSDGVWFALAEYSMNAEA